jgi:hypothetical protein
VIEFNRHLPQCAKFRRAGYSQAEPLYASAPICNDKTAQCGASSL